MITVNDVSMNFSGQTLFKHVDLKFIPGNCYGIIGANGAGKSTFLRILSGDLEPTTGEVIIPKEERMSILKQDHFQYDAYTVLDTVILGNQHLYDIMKEKDALYAVSYTHLNAHRLNSLFSLRWWSGGRASSADHGGLSDLHPQHALFCLCALSRACIDRRTRAQWTKASIPVCG